MARFWVILAVVAVAFVIYSLVDCAMADRARIRGPRKGIWILLILLLPVVGALLWFVIGRGRAPSARRPAPRMVAPDDDPTFLAGLRRDADEDASLREFEKEFGTGPDPQDASGEAPEAPNPDGPDPRGDGTGTDGPGASGRRDV